jgi:hypothetical protein
VSDEKGKKGPVAEQVEYWAAVVFSIVAMAAFMFAVFSFFRYLPDIVKGASRAASSIKKAAVDGWEEGSR